MFYTKKGDDGASGLFGTKNRMRKDNPVYHALGTLDELNSLLGICRAKASASKLADAEEEIRKAQESLFVIQAEIAGAEKSITAARVEGLESIIDAIEESAGNPHSFVIPGATEFSAYLDYARAVSRRAERTVIEAAGISSVSDMSRAYLNRLSSLLYALARYAAAEEGVREPSPSYLR